MAAGMENRRHKSPKAIVRQYGKRYGIRRQKTDDDLDFNCWRSISVAQPLTPPPLATNGCLDDISERIFPCAKWFQQPPLRREVKPISVLIFRIIHDNPAIREFILFCIRSYSRKPIRIHGGSAFMFISPLPGILFIHVDIYQSTSRTRCEGCHSSWSFNGDDQDVIIEYGGAR